MAHDRFRVSCMQLPGFIEYLLFVDSHSHVLTKMLSPRGYHVIQSEQAGMIQAFVNPALERAVASACSLNFFHQNSKPLSILAGDCVFDCYCNRTVAMLRRDGKIVQRVEWRRINAGFAGEVDGKSMPEG